MRLVVCYLACLPASILFAATPATTQSETAADARVAEISAALPAAPTGIGRPITDRDAWRRFVNRGFSGDAIRKAEALAAQPVPSASDDLYREFSRNGNRSRYESIAFQRRRNFVELVLAECAEDKGRFLPKIAEYADSFCAEHTWVWPAHDKDLKNFDRKISEIDLGTAELGWLLATARSVLAERLPRDVSDRIAANVTRRVVEPYLAAATGRAKEFGWMTRTNNWNAVCHAGVVGAALAVEHDRTKRAIIVASAERNLQRFIDGFGEDGYCSEGLGYWNYGFGHYILLAETVRQATSGRVDLMDRPGVRAIATFGRRIEITNGVIPAFADCAIDARPSPQILRYVDARFASHGEGMEPPTVRSERAFLYDVAIYGFLDPASLPKTDESGASARDAAALRSWFASAGVLVARPTPGSACRIGVALKGGNNAENHNHNDLGSYVVVLDGEHVLLDPGPERYTARTFGPHRYESKLLNSFGHPVPLIAGQLQRAGAAAHATILKTEFADDIDADVMDLTSAYDVPDLKRLERTFVYDRRGAGSLTVTDRVEYATPQTFGTALITLGHVSARDADSFLVGDGKHDLRARLNTGGLAYEIVSEEIHEDAAVTPTRIGINLKEKVTAATITVQIAPP